MAYGIENYQYHGFDEVKINRNALNPIRVVNGQTNEIGGAATVGVKILDHDNAEDRNASKEKNTKLAVQGVLMRDDENMDLVYDIKKVLEAPVCKGERVGTITYLVNGEKWKVENVILTENVDKIDFQWCLKMIIQKYCLK